MMKQMDINVKNFLQFQLQLKILHWQTKGYARHIAFGETYDVLDGLIDNYVEVCMGKHGRFTLSNENKTITLENLSDIKMVQFIQKFKLFLTSLTNDLSPEEDTDLLNIKDEMLASVNKLAYLLTLE